MTRAKTEIHLPPNKGAKAYAPGTQIEIRLGEDPVWDNTEIVSGPYCTSEEQRAEYRRAFGGSAPSHYHLCKSVIRQPGRKPGLMKVYTRSIRLAREHHS